MAENRNRRQFGKLALAGAIGAVAGGPAFAQAPAGLQRRVSGSISRRWEDCFDSIEADPILCDINDRTLHYRGADGF